MSTGRQAAGRRILPAVVTVGDELILGERDNGNQRWLLHTLWERGHAARVALSLPDDVATIAQWIGLLRARELFPVLVSGGIGGTHDDCTRQGIAEGLGIPLQRHPECHDLLAARYGERYTPQRQRMAMLPAGCRLIDNDSGAPGFEVGGVYAFPGFPSMLQPMAAAVLDRLLGPPGEPRWILREAVLAAAEGDIAEDVERFGQSHPGAQIGIYPSTERFGREVTLRMRAPAGDTATADAFDALVARLRDS